jgi:hypothetical protein
MYARDHRNRIDDLRFHSSERTPRSIPHQRGAGGVQHLFMAGAAAGPRRRG